jgi:rhodanese-related sulfurtransferase
MKATVALTAAAAALATWAVPGSTARACGDHEEHMASIQKVDVKQLVELQKRQAYVLDANGEKTRADEGVIPGAMLLTSATSYDVQKELPIVKEAPLVFYCFNEQCRASTIAAERAVKAGYTNVAVLPVGIKGWKAANQKTAHPNT